LPALPAREDPASISTEKQLFKLPFADFSLLIIIAMCAGSEEQREAFALQVEENGQQLFLKQTAMQEAGGSKRKLANHQKPKPNNLRERSSANTDIYQSLAIKITIYQLEYVKD